MPKAAKPRRACCWRPEPLRSPLQLEGSSVPSGVSSVLEVLRHTFLNYLYLMYTMRSDAFGQILALIRICTALPSGTSSTHRKMVILRDLKFELSARTPTPFLCNTCMRMGTNTYFHYVTAPLPVSKLLPARIGCSLVRRSLTYDLCASCTRNY